MAANNLQQSLKTIMAASPPDLLGTVVSTLQSMGLPALPVPPNLAAASTTHTPTATEYRKGTMTQTVTTVVTAGSMVGQTLPMHKIGV